MSKGKWLVMACLICVTAYAQQADYRKMSGMVRRMAVQHNPQRHITTFVQTTDKPQQDLWKDNGCRELARIGDIAIVDIPLGRLAALSANPAVRRIEASRRCHTLMDTTRTIVNALPAYTATATHQAFTGKGVIMGLIDVGFDLTHPTFHDTTTNTCRISALWDQLSQDTIGSTLPVGRDYTTPEEVAALGCTVNGRTQYHGTHTLGIAAGNGYDSPYCGMAPESDICLVCNAVTEDTIYIRHEDLEKYTTATDALGFKYLFDYADSQGKPCVISFSEGYIETANEDDRLFAEVLERLTGPGRIIVVAAGNEGGRNTYFDKQPDETAAGAFLHTGDSKADYIIQGNGDFLLRLLVYSDDSKLPIDTLTLSSADGRMDSLLCDTLFCGNDTCAVSISRHESFYGSGMMYVLTMTANRQFYNMPQIAMVVEGKGSYVQFYGRRECSLGNGGFYSDKPIDERWSAAYEGHNLLAPGSFPAVICVGATVHRTEFRNYKGERAGVQNGAVPGTRMWASSTGPTKDGRTKPDVMAPGINVISAYSSYYLEANPTAGANQSNVARFDYQGRTYAWHSTSGTSMACPVVAGSIALWLQANPTLTRDDILGIFQRTCRRPDTSLSYPNNVYGHGEIDTYKGLLDVLGISKIEEISKEKVQGVDIRLKNGALRLSFSRQPSVPVTVSIYSTNGQLLQKNTLPTGCSEYTIAMPHHQGVMAVQLNSSDSTLCGSALVRL